MIYILVTLFYFGSAALILWLTTKSKTADKIGAVVIAYAVGLIFGNSGLITEQLKDFQELLSNITIGIAIPLLLFSSDLKLWFKTIGKAFSSLILGVLAVVIMIFVGYFIFKGKIDDLWKICGMLTGLYTGGTPNLAALKTALSVPQSTYIIVHSSDMIIGAIILFLVMAVGQKGFELFLPKFKDTELKKLEVFDNTVSDFNDYTKYFQKQNLLNTIIAIFLAFVILGISFLAGQVSVTFNTLITILTLTTLGLAASFIKPIRNLKKTFPTGMYFIYVFSIIVASMADFSSFVNIQSLNILALILIIVIGSFLLHALFSYFFKIDADTFIISTVALVYSAPFVPIVASALKNKYIIVSGIVCALIGYAIGNYLGVFLAYILKVI